MGSAITVVCAVVAALVAVEVILRRLDLLDPPIFEANPQYGFLMRPNQSASPRGHRFQINRFGLRGRDFVMPKPPDVYRVGFWGDSIPYGGGSITDADLFVNIVASQLQMHMGRRVEAINVSAPGWGIGNIVSYVQCAGRYDADLVIWVVPEDDLRRKQTSLSTYPGFPLKTMRFRLGFLLKVGLARLDLYFRRRRVRSQNLVPSSRLLAQNIETLRRQITQVRDQGTPILIVLVPPEGGYGRPRDVDAIRRAIAACSVPDLDLAASLIGHPQYFIDGVHLSAAGHKVVGDRITAFLRQTAILDGNRSAEVRWQPPMTLAPG